MNPDIPAMKTCKHCGQPMASEAPEGLCARCLLSAALKEPSAAGSPTSGILNAPTPEELGPHFPQFEIMELLGRGGMGAVYKAKQRQLDRVVALKILPPTTSNDSQFAERFQREARALARLNHPHIVTVHDFGQSEGLYYLIMEFVDGANLRTLIRSGELRSEQALAIVPRICDALQYAHDEGVVHRDIKPENVLIDKKGRVKIADFGLAKLLGRESADLTMITHTGMNLGTPRYMAPEQVEHPEQVDHRADIYSLGVVFYEMLTGELPMGRFDPPSAKVQVDVRLDEVVLRSLEKNVERRYQHASEVKTDVEDITGVIDRLPPSLRHMMGVEYRSQRTLFGWPLLHIAHGMDPRTGEKRVARGIIAIGDNAIGVLAMGGFTRGVFSFGGVAIGIFAIGGIGVGLFSLAGLSIGLLLADGGLAIGTIAWGGAAIGYLAMGGGAWGVHYAGGNGADAIGSVAIRYWAPLMQKIFMGSWLVFIPLLAVSIYARFWAIRQAPKHSSASTHTRAKAESASSPQTKPRRRRVLGVSLTLLWLLAFFFGLGMTAAKTGESQRFSLGSMDPWFVWKFGPAGGGFTLNIFTWSFLALAIVGYLTPALFRLDREDKGKVPRDPAWWKEWLKGMCIWCGLLLVGVSIRTIINAVSS